MPPRRSPSTARRRAPRGSLDRERVVRTALELMSGDDAPPLTMQRVADAMNTRPMSLYSHVGGRDDLVNAAAELALREWELELPARGGWERQVRVWCGSLRDRVRRYPALVGEIARGGKFHPAMLEKVVALGRCLRRAGVSERELAGLLRWIPQTILGACVLELTRPGDLQTVHDEVSAIYASMGALGPEDRAELAGVLPHFTDPSLGDLFDYTVDRLIDGIRAVAGKESR